MRFVSSLEKSLFGSSDQWHGTQGRMKVRPAGEREDQGFLRQQGQRFNTPWQAGHAYNISCKWEPFKAQIMEQWNRLTSREIDAVGPNRSKLAMLIENKYGIAAHLVENYLRNFERTLPLI